VHPHPKGPLRTTHQAIAAAAAVVVVVVAVAAAATTATTATATGAATTTTAASVCVAAVVAVFAKKALGENPLMIMIPLVCCGVFQVLEETTCV
jgi:hypothetical protein